MLIAIGLDTDPTMVHFVSRASALDGGLDFLNLRSAVRGSWDIPVAVDRSAHFALAGRELVLRPGDRLYCRLIDLAPAIRAPRLRARWRMLMAGLIAWLEQARGVVVNRPGHAADNGSKPLHEHWLRRAGFLIPESLTASSRARLAAFCEGGPTIAKSVAGVRADTREVTADSFDEFAPEQGPVHLQRKISGDDARLHVVGDTVHAEFIRSAGVDYRIAGASFRPFEPPSDLAAAVVRATREAGLAFAGWDFKIDADGRFWCLEANPMPGYDGYDRRANGAITRSLVEYLRSPP